MPVAVAFRQTLVVHLAVQQRFVEGGFRPEAVVVQPLDGDAKRRKLLPVHGKRSTAKVKLA
jgi:hypothetical protein